MASAREQWREERRQGIGGSDVDDALGEAPYGCARRLAYDKLNIPADYPEDKALLFQRGNDLEPLVCQRYTEETGRKVIRRPTAVHPTVPWARVNVDREILGANEVTVITPEGERSLDQPGVGVLEVKTRAAASYARVKREGLLPSDVLQLQWGMWVRNRRWGSFAVLNPETWELIKFDVEFDPDLIARIEPYVQAVWDKIQHEELPAKLDPTDKRCLRCAWRRTCQGDAIATATLPSEERDIEVERDDSLLELFTDRAEVKRALDEYQGILELIDGRLKGAIGSRGIVETTGWRAYYRAVAARKMIDMKKLEKQFPDAYTACLTTAKASKPLRIYAV